MLPMTEKRAAANRRNAQKSTGPQSQAGKDISRANSLKHGLCAIKLSVENEGLVRQRAIGVFESLRPQTDFQAWVCATIAIITIRLDRLRDLERQIRKGAAWRADTFWDDDQRDEAKRIGGRLHRNPEKVVAQLRRSAHGCDWLIERWAMLLSVAQRGQWSDEQKILANDLLSTPRQLRGDAPGFTVDENGQTLNTGVNEAALAQTQLAELKIHQERVEDADAIARRLAIADLDDFHNPNLIRLRRYERALQIEFHRLCTLSQFESAQAAPNTKCPVSIPAHFFDPPTIPNEPIASILPEIPNEPTTLLSPEIPNEPTAFLTPEIQNEPIASILPEIQNEPIASIPPEIQNEPIAFLAPKIPNEPTDLIPAAVQHETADSTRPEIQNEAIVPTAPSARNKPTGPAFLEAMPPIDPELLAVLEAGLPDPNTLDPAWCREFITAQLGVDETGRLRMPEFPLHRHKS